MSVFDVNFYGLNEQINWPLHENRPIACLLVIDGDIDQKWLSSFIVHAVKNGCKSFLCWGANADELHDQIDMILENGDDDWLSVLTVSCRDEDAEGVSILLFVATFPNRTDAYYLVITDGAIDNLKSMIMPPEI